jgi:type IV pilus assembly protein PilF
MRPDFTRYLLSFALMVLIGCTSKADKKFSDNTDVYMQLGVRYLNLNKLALAKENLEIALKEDSSSIPANNAMAFLYEKLNKFPEANDYYETAYKLDSENLEVLNNYGRFLCDRREFDKGMSLLEQAINNRLNERPWLALTNAGRCQLSMGNMPNAKNYFLKAMDFNPSYPPALMEMQKISYQTNNYKLAQHYFNQFMSTDSYSPESLWIAIQTERILGNDVGAQNYQNTLLVKFPSSNEAKQIKAVLHIP